MLPFASLSLLHTSSAGVGAALAAARSGASVVCVHGKTTVNIDDVIFNAPSGVGGG